MFQQVFKAQLNVVTNDRALIEDLWNEIKGCYTVEGRHYHTLLHLDHLVEELMAVKDQITDWQTLVFSIAYHDIVYNPLKRDNEEKSAKLASKRLSSLSLPPLLIEKCTSQILSTRHHESSVDSDTNYFTDADLAILGADGKKYREYAALIRKEYKFDPDFMYNTGRQQVLNHFLGMLRIYKTEYFRRKYETQARQNILRELGELTR
jgi:predicted metal-dependent HD superfamily phosphohydrolase